MIRRMKQFLKMQYYAFMYRHKCTFGTNTIISRITTFDGMNHIGSESRFDGHLGFGSYVSAHCDISMTKIGKYTSIGPRVVVNPGRHPLTYPFVTTCPAFYSSRKQNSDSYVNENFFDEIKYIDNEFSVIIGNDCWLGEGVFITGGVTICDGAIVLAHAVVTKNVEPYSIVGGVPAKHIKYRYSQDDIRLLEKFEWWNKPISWLKENNELLRDLNKLKEYIKHESI